MLSWFAPTSCWGFAISCEELNIAIAALQIIALFAALFAALIAYRQYKASVEQSKQQADEASKRWNIDRMNRSIDTWLRIYDVAESMDSEIKRFLILIDQGEAHSPPSSEIALDKLRVLLEMMNLILLNWRTQKENGEREKMPMLNDPEWVRWLGNMFANDDVVALWPHVRSRFDSEMIAALDEKFQISARLNSAST